MVKRLRDLLLVTMDDELEEIRAQKRAEIQAELQGTDGQESTGSTGAPSSPIHVEGEGDLNQLTAEHEVVLVDFYADWCGPCQMLEPIVETLAAETEATVAKVDVDVQQALAAQFQVRGVPTLVLFADGEPVEHITGVRGEDELRGLIGQYT